MIEMLGDKIPNIRVLSLKCISQNRKLMDKGCEVAIQKMRDDNDMEIKQAAR